MIIRITPSNFYLFIFCNFYNNLIKIIFNFYLQNLFINHLFVNQVICLMLGYYFSYVYLDYIILKLFVNFHVIIYLHIVIIIDFLFRLYLFSTNI